MLKVPGLSNTSKSVLSSMVVPKLFGKWWCGNLKSLEVVRVNVVGDLPRLVDGLAVLGLQ